MGWKVVPLLVAALLCNGAVEAGDQVLRAEVEHPVVKSLEAGDPEVVMYNILFNLRITNIGKEAVNVGRVPIVVMAVQNRGADGAWNNLNQNSWYDDGTAKHVSCSSLSPGRTAVFSSLETGLSILDTQLAKLGDQPVLRFQIQILCKRTDGVVMGAPAFKTEPVTVQLPAAAGGKPPGNR